MYNVPIYIYIYNMCAMRTHIHAYTQARYYVMKEYGLRELYDSGALLTRLSEYVCIHTCMHTYRAS